MKKTLFIILILPFFLNAQNKMDTLFFKYDENYILFYEDYKKWSDVSYKDFEREILKTMLKNNTQGYFLLQKLDTLYNLKPKKLYSLKNYVEKRKFYLDGVYNKTVDRKKIKQKIFNKYKIFIVVGSQFIEISQNPHENFYNSYFPIHYHNEKKYPQHLIDTLFIKYDKSFLTKKIDSIENQNFYLIKGTGNNGLVLLFEKKEYSTVKSNKILCLKDVLKKSNAYYEKEKLDDWELAVFLSQYIIFLVERDNYIKVGVSHEIE